MKLTEGVHGSVSLGDFSKLPVEGKGKIKIYQKDNKPEYISDAYYIPSMNNIFSASINYSKKDIKYIWRTTIVVGKCKRRPHGWVKMKRNHMFPLHLNMTVEKCFQGLVENESWRWHLRFDHLNFNSLKLLSTAGMV